MAINYHLKTFYDVLPSKNSTCGGLSGIIQHSIVQEELTQKNTLKFLSDYPGVKYYHIAYSIFSVDRYIRVYPPTKNTFDVPELLPTFEINGATWFEDFVGFSSPEWQARGFADPVTQFLLFQEQCCFHFNLGRSYIVGWDTEPSAINCYIFKYTYSDVGGDYFYPIFFVGNDPRWEVQFVI
jgi:hypothetical protein